MKQVLRSVGKQVNYYLRNPSELIHPKRDILTTTRDGIRLLCSNENYIEQHIMRHGVFEPRSTDAVLATVRPGQVAVDVGANSGYFTLLLSRLVGPEGSVHAFEPTRWGYSRCLANLARNDDIGHSNCRIHQIGLSDTEHVAMESIESQFSLKSLAYSTREKITFNTLDRYCKDEGIDRVDFIKIDVDGHDIKVLSGARGVVSRSRPVLLLEFNEKMLRENGGSVREYAALLQELGYRRGTFLDGSPEGTFDLHDIPGRDRPSADISMNVLIRAEG